MRISDWSSDVCSSDLATSGNGTLTQNRHQGKTNFDAHAKSCLARPARGETIPNQAIETQRKRRRPHGRRMSLFYNCQIGRASCRERVCQYVYSWVVAVSLKKKINKTTQINRNT